MTQNRNSSLVDDAQLVLGKYIRACKDLGEYKKNNPDIDVLSDEKYQALVNNQTRAARRIINLSPTLKDEYGDVKNFPIIDGDKVLPQHINKIITTALFEDVQKQASVGNKTIGDFSDVIQPVTITTIKKDKDGEPIFELVPTDEDGVLAAKPQLETISVFTIKGSNTQEVQSTLQKLAETIASPFQSEINRLKEELEDIDIPDIPNLQVNQEEIKKMVSDEMTAQTTDSLKKVIVRILESPEGQQATAKGLTLQRYANEINNYIQDIKKIHLLEDNGQVAPSSPFGNLLLNQLSYIDESKNRVNGLGLNALYEYLFQSVQERMATLPKEIKFILNNPDGSNQQANEIYRNLLDKAFNAAINKLAGDNPTVPNNLWQSPTPENPYLPKPESFTERMTRPGAFAGVLSNPLETANYLANGYNPNPQQYPNNFSQYNSLPATSQYGPMANTPQLEQKPAAADPYSEEQNRISNAINDISFTPTPASSNRKLVLGEEDKI